MLTARIIVESLRPGIELSVPGMRIVRLTRTDVTASAAPGQPPIWSLLDVEAPDDRADDLASALEATLDAPGWYADFRVAGDQVIVFRGRSFRYPEGDAAGRAAAADYGRGAGVPENQLDWDR